jgi:ABC-type branched-subunit amino acid transport system substrate-binding protein
LNVRLARVALLVVFLCACGVGAPNQNAPAIARVGLIVSFKGSGPLAAEPAIQGATVAVADVNKDLLAGRTLQLVTVDDSAGPAAACQSLVEQDHVVAIVGVEDAAARSACSASLRQLQVPYLAARGADSGQCSTNMFFLDLTPLQRVVGLVTYFVATLQARRFYLVSSDTAAGRALAASAGGVIEQAGGAVVKTAFAAPGAPPAQAISIIPASKPDAVIDLRTGADALAFQQAYSASAAVSGYPHGSLGLDALSLGALGASGAGAYVATDYLSTDPAPGNTEWLAAVNKRYGDGAVPSATGAAAYDGVELVAEALGRAGIAGGPQVLGELTRVSVSGPRGDVRIAAGNHGYSTLGAHIGRIKPSGVIEQLQISPPIEPAVTCG